MQACKWIIGATPYLDLVHAAWSAAFPQIQIEKIKLAQDSRHQFDLAPLNLLDPTQGKIFVAFDERFGNFKRAELMQAVIDRGFKLAHFISPYANVAANAVVGPNVFIDAGVYVGAGTQIDYNTVINAGAKLGTGVHLRASCWVEMGVTIGNQVTIGAHSTLRMGAIVAANIKIGRCCELGWPMRYDKDITAKTIFDPRYCEPVYVYNQ